MSKKEKKIKVRYKGLFSGLIIFGSCFLLYQETSYLAKVNIVQAYVTMIVILGLLICSFAIFIALYEKKGNKHNLKKRKKGEVEITYLEYILSEENKELFNTVMDTDEGKFVNNDSLLKKGFDSEFKKNRNKEQFFNDSYLFYVKENTGIFLNEKKGIFFAKIKGNDSLFILGTNPFNYLHNLVKIEDLGIQEREDCSLEVYYELIEKEYQIDLKEKTPEELQELIPELKGKVNSTEESIPLKILNKFKFKKIEK
jgi:hypothetical protein